MRRWQYLELSQMSSRTQMYAATVPHEALLPGTAVAIRGRAAGQEAPGIEDGGKAAPDLVAAVQHEDRYRHALALVDLDSRAGLRVGEHRVSQHGPVAWHVY